MKILVTGATGFIGQQLVKALIDHGHNIVTPVRRKNSRLPLSVKQHIIEDLTEISLKNPPKIINQMLQDSDVVIHLAGRAHIIKESSLDPAKEFHKANCQATSIIATLAAHAGVKRFIFLSSIKANGENTQPNLPFQPDKIYSEITDPYGLSKLTAEQKLKNINKETGMEVVIIRPPLVYGPGAQANFSKLVTLVKKEIPLPFGNINNLRSLIGIENLIDFILLCSNPKASPKAANQTFLISDDQDVSTTELLYNISSAYNVRLRLISVPIFLLKACAIALGKNQEIDRLITSLQVDISKTKELLGWRPILTMEQQLEKMATSHQEKEREHETQL